MKGFQSAEGTAGKADRGSQKGALDAAVGETSGPLPEAADPDTHSGTPYDGAFHTIVLHLRRLLVLFMNFVFGQHYTGSEKLTFGATELEIYDGGGQPRRRIMDSHFTIEDPVSCMNYHLECESKYDPRMMDRMWEYDANAIIIHHGIGGNVHQFPKSAVLYLRPPRRLEEGTMRDTVKMLDGNATYAVRVLIPNAHSAQDMLRTDRLVMLPFYMFRYESQAAHMTTDDKRHVLDDVQRLCNGLRHLQKKGEIMEYEASLLTEMFMYVTSHLIKDAEIMEGVEAIMRENMAPSRTVEIYEEGQEAGLQKGIREGIQKGIQEGIQEGIQKGQKEGRDEMLAAIVHHMRADHSLEEIAGLTGVSAEQVRAVW